MENKKIAEELNIFKEDHALSFIYQKTKRICSALYIITNLFLNSEPAKWKIRKLSIKLISDISTYLSLKEDVSRHDLLGTIKGTFSELSAMLETLSDCGALSSMNSEIIIFELNNIVILLREVRTSQLAREGPVIFSNDFFQVGTAQSLVANIVKNESENNRVLPSSFYGKDVSSLKTGQLTRRDRIFNALLGQDKVGIKGIAKIVTGCSEKTIQRELVIMVQDGVLKKEGARRWSTYSLIPFKN